MIAFDGHVVLEQDNGESIELKANNDSVALYISSYSVAFSLLSFGTAWNILRGRNRFVNRFIQDAAQPIDVFVQNERIASLRQNSVGSNRMSFRWLTIIKGYFLR